MTSKARQLASEPNQQQAGRRNVLINGNFDVWQRGTGAFTLNNAYSADRWLQLVGTTTLSTSQSSFTLGQTDVPNNPKHFTTCTVTTGSTAGSYAILQQKIEGVETFAGKTITLSFWAKADASKDVAIEIGQNFGTSGSPSSQVTGTPTTVSLTTSWKKHTVTVTMPSVSGKTRGTDGNDNLYLFFWFEAGSTYNDRTNSLGNQSGIFDIAQVQLEAGKVATPFEHRSYGEELALCQRYFYVGQGRFHYGNYGEEHYDFKTTMRANPTVTLVSVPSGGSVNRTRLDWVTITGMGSSTGNIAIQADAEL